MGRTVFSAADILLPADENYETWAVVACDQFTSQPEYWERVEKTVGDRPSTFRIILPEAQLSDGHTEEHIDKINATMKEYLSKGVFRELPEAMIYLERVQSDGKVRKGLIGKIDLEEYDYSAGSTSPVRATEGTVLDRIPPRQAVRRDAAVELPHVMLLIDDINDTVIGPLKECSEVLYDFDLMEGGGHAKGWLVPPDLQEGAVAALGKLADEQPLLFAVGDGNHSLASAKALYEEEKAKFGPGSENTLPSRYALVEIVNLYDTALEFEPIHRVLFDVDAPALMEALKAEYPGTFEGKGEGHVIRYAYDGAEGFITVPDPKAQLEVGTLQSFLDKYIKANEIGIDYVHGDEITIELGKKPGCMAFLLPAMDKGDLFKSVINDGALPRKTFSMGHAEDKRYYIEARRIK
ncbi:MAG: DUF1015 domain-containing protein [Bacillota bacterium]|nr:DUF1015 domain-containing protein [Bacillota bacterium]